MTDTLTPVLTALGRAAVDARRLRAPRRLPGAAEGADLGARTTHRDGQGLRPARPWRRGLPDRHEVELHPAGRRQAALPRVNADEGEPGTCKDMPLMMADPHSLIEGIIIACYAIRADTRSSTSAARWCTSIRRVQPRSARPTPRATSARTSSAPASTSMIVHAGAGAYICGEETALLDSLEGNRGQPRLGRRSRRSTASTPARPWSTTSSRSPACRRSSPAARTGSTTWAPRSRTGFGSSRCPATSTTRASTRRRWAPRCAS